MMRARLGPYQVLDRIGAGGMGEIFAATHERMDHKVAVKVLSEAAASDQQLVARLLQEGRALAALEHPGIVRILHCDQLDDGTVYLAMEYLDGKPLREWLEHEPGMARLAALLDIGSQIADAMVAVHEQGIVHRDLKPENILLLPDPGQPSGHHVKLLDFGIAKMQPVFDRPLVDTLVNTTAPVILGTVTYMAPEQCRNAAEVTDRADVYALGVLLFEMLAGRPPFMAAEPIDVISMHVQSEPPSLLELAPGAPGVLGAFIHSMLSKEPEKRPSMRRVRDMLSRAWNSPGQVGNECPLPGLHAFSDSHAELFFGRRNEIDELLATVEKARTGRPGWLMIEGPSGAGKTSLVQAGLLPALCEANAAKAPLWRIACMRPADDAPGHLTRALAEAYGKDDPGLTQTKVAKALRSRGLHAWLMERTPPGCVVLLVIEQMEELFARDDASARELDALLTRALDGEESPLRLLTTMRSDFLHRFEHLPGLARLFDTAARYSLRTMEKRALTEVVHGMARRAGMQMSEGLAERMVHDAASSGNPLPLLSHTLYRLWTPQGALLTHESYEKLGGVSGALARHANELLDSLGEDGRNRAKWLLLALVHVGRGVSDTRRPRSHDELLRAAGGAGNDRLAHEVLARLSGERPWDTRGQTTQNLRLVVLSGAADVSFGQQRVELIHETLLRQVPQIAGWLDEERARLERHADVEVAAQAWEQSGAPLDGLPSGTLLAHYCGYRGDRQQREVFARLASERARRFVNTAQRLEHRRRRIRRALAGILALAAVAILVSAIHARQEQQRAETNLQHVLLATEQVVSDADWTLARFHHTLRVRRQMLQHIHDNLTSLPAEERDSFEVRKALIKTKHRLGDLARLNDPLARADSLYKEARALIDDSLQRWPTNQALLELVALNHSKLGKVALARGRWQDAHREFEDSLELFQRLGMEQGDKGARRTLAVSSWEKADLELARNRPRDATAWYDKALALMALNQGDYDHSLRALMLASRGRAARKSHDLTGAAGYLAEALRLQKEVVQANPGNALYRYILARIHVELAALHTMDNQLDHAAEHDARGRTLARALHQGDPQNKDYALVFGHSLQISEALAERRGEAIRAAHARAERCTLAAELMAADPEDMRFQALACP